MAETVQSVKRSKFAEFLNVTPNAETPKWARIGKGVSDNEISYNANVVSEIFIHEDNASNSIDSYAPQIGVTQYAYKGDEVFDFVDDLRIKRAKGTDAETQILMVYMYRDATGSGYVAETNKVAIQLDTYGGQGGERISVGYNILFDGDPTLGVATISNGTVSFKADTKE